MDSQEFSRGAAPDLWRNTLSQIPTVFGKLVYLSSLRDQNSGQYQHYGLSHIYSEEEADVTLRQSHKQVFGEWLCFGLQRQKSEIDRYLADLEQDTASILATWIKLKPYSGLAPAEAREVERQLYMDDIEVVLELLKSEHEIASPDPDA